MSSPSTSKQTIKKYSSKEKSNQQNEKFCDILAEHKALLLQLTKQNKEIQSLRNIFPIKSIDALKQLDDLLLTQPELYVRQMKILLASNVCKNLHEVFANKLIMDFNIDGTLGKSRLRDFKNVYARLIEAISASEDEPEKQLRVAIHKEKKKTFRKPKSQAKEKENIPASNTSSDVEELVNNFLSQ